MLAGLPKASVVQLSAVVGSVQFTTAEQTPASAAWMMSLGMSEMTGSWVSVTVTLKDIVELLPWMSVAV